MASKKTDYERLGRMLHDIVETGYSSRWKMYRFVFIKGMVGGFGGVLGATLVVAALLWIFSVLGRVPLIGPFVDSLQETIKTNP
jgi:hypothetical protein